MKSRTPKVSVIVPLYNQGRFLPECLGSLQKQTCADWEAVVIDDGSTDDSLAAAERLAARDSRIQVFSKPNGGLADARNFGLERASGEFIQFLDSDDALLPRKFERQLAQLADAPLGSVSVSHHRIGSHDCLEHEPHPPMTFGLTEKTTLVEFIDRWEFGICVPCHCFLIPAKYFIARDGLRFDSRLENHEDFECWVRLLSRRPNILVLEECLAVYREHPAGMSRNLEKMRKGFFAAVDALLAHVELPPTAHRRLRAKKREITRVYDRRMGLSAPPFPFDRLPRVRIALGGLRNKLTHRLLGRVQHW